VNIFQVQTITWKSEAYGRLPTFARSTKTLSSCRQVLPGSKKLKVEKFIPRQPQSQHGNNAHDRLPLTSECEPTCQPGWAMPWWAVAMVTGGAIY